MEPVFTGEIIFDMPSALLVDNPAMLGNYIEDLIDEQLCINQEVLLEVQEKLNIPYLALTLVDADTESDVDNSTELFHIGVTLTEYYPFSLEVH